jgi:hypothetical protein
VRGALQPITRDTESPGGEKVREFDLRSAAIVIGSFIGVLFLIFFLSAFLPWLLANGMTAAVEGLMHQVGESSFEANDLGDWLYVLIIGAVFTAFIVVLAVAILALYNLISKRTGMTAPVMREEVGGAPERPVLVESKLEEEEDDQTFDELYAEAQRKGIAGRSTMSKAELQAALKPKRRRAGARRT